LRQAYERVMLVANRIKDESLRRGWLENVRFNQEILADWAAVTKDLDLLTEYVRHGMARTITKLHQTADGFKLTQRRKHPWR